MSGYIGYIRVSTVKQGTQGVSLLEQREAISSYAERNGLAVSIWREEMETAAKHGRPVFNEALKLLRQGKAKGIILHKLDRGARNLRDWNDIGELSDQGIEVHFVNESLDLKSRGGRLSADIQAVVAADFIRNQREETRKGFYGRLKQGLYPLRAPLGYCDNGKAKAKTFDPIMGPLVRKGFELYSTGRHSLDTLGEELDRLGLRNSHGGRVTRNGLSTMLNNPFYIGLIRIHKTGENFAGKHRPLIRKVIFDRVQDVLAGKTNVRLQRHDFAFRRMLTCRHCGYSLIGERQKGHVYYRCHGTECAGTAVREEAVATAVKTFLQALSFTDQERAFFKSRVSLLRSDWVHQQEEEFQALQLRLGQIKDRLDRLTDAYLDGALDRAAFEQRKESLLRDQKGAEDSLKNQKATSFPDRLEKFLELAGNAWLSHEMADTEEKRELLKILTSNRIVAGKNVELEPSLPFGIILNRSKNECCEQQRDTPRTFDQILSQLIMLNTAGHWPDLDSVLSFSKS